MADRIPGKTLTAYVALALPLGMIQVPLFILLPRFYTDTVGIGMATVGTIWFVGRLVDALIDPFIGWVSDHVPILGHRRRPYIALAVIPLCVSIYMLFAPPDPVGATWVGVAVVGVCLFSSLVVVPYEALGVEITSTYDERTRVFGLRDGVALLGVLVSVALGPTLMATLELGEGALAARQQHRALAYVLIVGLLVATTWCLFRVQETRPVRSGGLTEKRRWQEIAQNRPYLVLLASYLFAGISTNLSAGLLTYFVLHVVGSPDVEKFLLVFIVSGLVCVPFWIWLTQRLEKRTAWSVALALSALVQVASLALGRGDEGGLLAVSIIAGIPFAAHIAIPASMQADTVDFGESLSGARQEGLYVGIWTVLRQAAAGMGVGAGLFLLGQAGYTPNAVQATEVHTTLRILYCVVPAAFNLLTIGLLQMYGLQRKDHALILAQLGTQAPPEQKSGL